MHLRLANDERVYIHRGETAWSIGDAPNRYFDPIYLEEDPEQVEQLTVSNPNGEHSMTRGEAGARSTERPREVWSKAKRMHWSEPSHPAHDGACDA